MSETKLNASALMTKERIAKMSTDNMSNKDHRIARKAKEVSKQPYSHERKYLNTVYHNDVAVKKLNNQRKYDLKQDIMFCSDPVKKAKLEAELALL